MADIGSGPDTINLSEEDNGNPEVFRENVRAAGRQAGAQVGVATKNDTTQGSQKTAHRFAQAGQIIVKQMNNK